MNLNSPCSVERAFLAEKLKWIADNLRYSAKSMVGLPHVLNKMETEIREVADELLTRFPCEGREK